MKTRNQFLGMAIAIIAIAIIGCSDGGGGNSSPETFTVTFNANGGTPQPPNQTIEKGKTATEPLAMTKTNNDFDGWYKESGFTTKWNFTTNSVTTNIDLHAKWTPYYGTLPNGIKIYKGDATITDAQMTDAVNTCIAGYNAIRESFGSPNGKFNKVLIISDPEYTWDGSVLGVNFDSGTNYFRGRFEKIANDTLDLTTD